MTGDFTKTGPVYEAASLFPAKEIFSKRGAKSVNFPEQRLPVKRLVFDSSKLAAPRPGLENISRRNQRSSLLDSQSVR